MYDTPINRPDLAIYSQLEQIANHKPPSWNNPDIATNIWPPFLLIPEAQVTLRNLSTTTGAMNVLVHFYTSPFGIGTARQLQLTRMANLGPGERAILMFPMPQAILAGDPRIGVHIRIDHPYDENPINNSGSQVLDGGSTLESGRDFDVQIPVVNNIPASRQIDLSILPTDLIASLTPSSHSFAPFEQIVANLHISVPPFLTSRRGGTVEKEVTVVGRVSGTGELIGGVTRLVDIDS